MAKQCEYTNENGQQCGGYAIDGSIYCLSHDPNQKNKRIERSQKGGSSETYQKLDLKLEPMTIKNASDIIGATVQTVNELREGKLPPKMASTIGYLLGIALKAFEQADLKNRVEVIERVILERSTK